MVLSVSTTVVLWTGTAEERVTLRPQALLVVPQGQWHRFEGSSNLQVLTITPQPTNHRRMPPEAQP